MESRDGREIFLALDRPYYWEKLEKTVDLTLCSS